METSINITNDFQGYIWMSDQPKPEVFNKDKERLLVLDDTKNPFIIEGQLFDDEKDAKKSYSIKYVDGKYRVVSYNVDDDDVQNAKPFYPNRIEKHLLFNQRWEEKKDEHCADMQVLQPAGFVFVGFGDKTKEE